METKMKMIKKVILTSSLIIATFSTAVASTPWGHQSMIASNRAILANIVMINFGPSDVKGIESHFSTGNFMHVYARQDKDRSPKYQIESKFGATTTTADMQLKLKTGNYTVMGMSYTSNPKLWWVRKY